MNLATLLEGPAIVTHLGQIFHFKGGLTLTPLADLFPIETDLYGNLDQRALDNSFVLSGTPVGVWTAAQIAALYRTASLTPGSLLTPRYDVLSVTAGTDVIVLVGTAAPRLAGPVRFVAFPGATLPGGIVGATTYYWGTNGKLYDTAAHATALGATGALDLTDAGTGDFAVIEQEPCIIDALTANRRITLWNSAVTTPPPVVLSAVATLLGQVTFGCFLREDAAWSDANSLYTVEKLALADTAVDPTEIPTQEYACAFGASPWDTFKPRGPITLTPSLTTNPVTSDALGTVGFRVASTGISATLAPLGFSEAQMLDLLGMQGTGVARGASRVRSDLIITGTGVHCTVRNGAPRSLPQTFQTTGPRAGELEIVGAAEPGVAPFRFATAAP